MSNPDVVKAIVRQRIAKYIEDHPTTPGYAFVLGDYIIEELLNDIVGSLNVISFWDAASGLPSEPEELDRYIASSTGNGWTANNVYTFLNGDWVETIFHSGLMIVYVESEDEYYGAYATSWKILSGVAVQQNPLPLNDYWQLLATDDDCQLQKKVNGSWIKKQRWY